MKKNTIKIAAFAVLLAFTGCTRDNLEVAQTANISTADLSLYNNNAGAESFVNAIYNKFLDWDMSSFSWNGITSISSDDADKGSSPGDNGTDKNKMDALTWVATDVSISEIFSANYQAINRANQALDILPKLDAADNSLRTRLTGEAKFLRALCYFNLVRVYGGVPIVDHLPNPASSADTDMQLTRKTSAEVYAFIESDLTAAAAVLPDRSAYAADQKGRASRGAAYALLAKVSLYQKKWSKVLEYANQVTGYSLTPDYSMIWRVEGENNQESIYEIQAINAGQNVKGIAGYSASQGARGAGGWGWGFNTPSQGLINAYEPGDTRKAATIILPGTTLYDGRVIPANVENPAYNMKAYSSQNSDAWETDKNIRILRYGEILLMKAEASNELGNTADAITNLNLIRHRAGLGDTTATSQAALRTAIYKERRVEMAFEHDRYFDLVRTGQAQAAFAADGKTFIVGKHEVFPLPQQFIDQSNGKSQQNPGY